MQLTTSPQHRCRRSSTFPYYLQGRCIEQIGELTIALKEFLKAMKGHSMEKVIKVFANERPELYRNLSI